MADMKIKHHVLTTFHSKESKRCWPENSVPFVGVVRATITELRWTTAVVVCVTYIAIPGPNSVAS
jgi:hypothetical protein